MLEQMTAFLINEYKFINILVCGCNVKIVKILQKFIIFKGLYDSTIKTYSQIYLYEGFFESFISNFVPFLFSVGLRTPTDPLENLEPFF